MCVCVVDERQKERKGRWLYLDRLNLQISNKTDQLRTRRKKYKDDEEKDTMFKCCVVGGEKVNEKDMRRVAVCILITKTILDAKLKTTIPIWFGYIEFKKKNRRSVNEYIAELVRQFRIRWRWWMEIAGNGGIDMVWWDRWVFFPFLPD